MKVYIMTHAGSVVGVYSSKKKLFKAYVEKNRKYLDENIKYINSNSRWISDVSDETKKEIIKLIKDEPCDIKKISYHDLTLCTNIDYVLESFTIDK